MCMYLDVIECTRILTIELAISQFVSLPGLKRECLAAGHPCSILFGLTVFHNC